MPAAAFLWIKNFDRFQHYKDRNPPWIKLYTALLSDPEFLKLPEAAQGQLMKLWLLAAQMGNPLPNEPRLLAGKIWVTGRFYLKELIAAGWLKPGDFASADASADASNGASAEGGSDASADASLSRAGTRVRGRARELEGEREGEELQRESRSSEGIPPKKKRSSSRGVADRPSPELKAAVRALPAEARDFLGTFWPADATEPAVRIAKAREIVATLNGGATFRGQKVRALSPERLAAKCRDVIAEPPRDPSKAMAVLLTKLADVGNAQDSPTEKAAVAAAASEDHDNRVGAERMHLALAWLASSPDHAAAIDETVDRELGKDAMPPIRAVYRNSVIARAWLKAGEPIVQPAETS